MKRFALLLSVFSLTASLLVAEDRIYVDPDQVIFEKNGLFVSTEDTILPINQLNYDEKGFYFCSSDVQAIQNRPCLYNSPLRRRK